MRFILSVLLILVCGATSVLADGLVINGSSTVYNYAFNGRIDDLRIKSALDFDVLSTSSGRGVKTLLDDTADIAMISADLSSILDKINTGRDKPLSVDDFDVYELASTQVLFVVHADNPVAFLTRDDLKDIFTGRAVHWSRFGAADLGNIKVVSEHPTGGMYNLVLSQVTHKKPLLEDKIILQNAPQVAKVVSQLPHGFGFLSNATPPEQRFGLKVIDIDGDPIVQRLAFVVRRGEKHLDILNFLDFMMGAF